MLIYCSNCGSSILLFAQIEDCLSLNSGHVLVSETLLFIFCLRTCYVHTSIINFSTANKKRRDVMYGAKHCGYLLNIHLTNMAP